jgi:hypothetical protein
LTSGPTIRLQASPGSRLCWQSGTVAPACLSRGVSCMRIFGEITDNDGKHRLQLLYIEHGKGWDFHSLVWETRDGQAWRERAVIPRNAFESGLDRQRWISQLHSFDPDTGRAVIMVAEGDQPKQSLDIHYVYSWREWDIAANSEVRIFRMCATPFEPFQKS